MIVVSAVEVGEPPLSAAVLVSGAGEAVDALSAASGDSLLLASEDDLSRGSRISRAVLDLPNIGLVRVGGTPTQRAAAVRFVSVLPVEAYGVAQEVCDAVRRDAVTLLALSSVAGLSGARASVGQHLRSWFPGASFEVDLSTGKVGSRRPVVWEPPSSALLCWAESAGRSGLEVELRGRPPGLVLPAVGGRRFGAREWVEMTMIEGGDGLVRQVLGSVRPVRCRGCSRSVSPMICPFCGTVPLSQEGSGSPGRRFS